DSYSPEHFRLRRQTKSQRVPRSSLRTELLRGRAHPAGRATHLLAGPSVALYAPGCRQSQARGVRRRRSDWRDLGSWRTVSDLQANCECPSAIGFFSFGLTVLQVPYLPQTNPQGRNSCVPAAVRMVLAFQGVALEEEDLCSLLETQQVGTPVLNVLLLTQHVPRCHAEVISASFDDLVRW